MTLDMPLEKYNKKSEIPVSQDVYSKVLESISHDICLIHYLATPP